MTDAELTIAMLHDEIARLKQQTKDMHRQIAALVRSNGGELRYSESELSDAVPVLLEGFDHATNERILLAK